VCILANSSKDLQEQQRVLSHCRAYLSKLSINSSQDLLRELNSDVAADICPHQELLQRFFRLSPDDGTILSLRLKLNNSSGMIVLPSVVHIFFEQNAKTPFVGYNPVCGDRSDETRQDSDDEHEDDWPLHRMQSNDPILLKNQATVSVFISAASQGGEAVQSLPVCETTADTDEVSSFHVEVVPFAQPDDEIAEEPFGGAKDSDDDGKDEDEAAR
jgi:hypothetical protein